MENEVELQTKFSGQFRNQYELMIKRSLLYKAIYLLTWQSIAIAEYKNSTRLWENHFHNNGGWVLDIGCGEGLNWKYAEKPKRLALIDLKPYDALTKFRYFAIGSAFQLPYSPLSMDGIVALGVMEYFSDMQNTLLQWKNVLKKDGRLLITNSHPTLGNYFRRSIYKDIYIRNNRLFQSELENCGFSLLESPRTAGLQTAFICSKST